MENVLLTVEEVAERLRFHPETIREYLRKGILRGIRLQSGDWRVTEGAIAEYLAKGER